MYVKWGGVSKNAFCEAGDDDLIFIIACRFLETYAKLEEINLVLFTHHLLFGHYMSWKSWNEYVRDDAVAWRTRILNRRRKVETLKQH